MGDTVKLAAVIVMLAGVALGQTNNWTPVMTSTNAPSPYIITESEPYNASYSAFRLFNNEGYSWHAQRQHTYDSILGTYFTLYLGETTNNVSLYQIRKNSPTDPTYPSAWTLAGSVNGTSWNTLDERTNVVIADGAYTSLVYEVSTSNRAVYPYLKFTINDTAYGLKYLFYMGSIKFWGIPIPATPLPARAVLGSTSSTGVSTLSGSDTGITVLQ